MENCHPQVDDLFSKIFTPDKKGRITFLEIRTHPLFAEHFPELSYRSTILYKKGKKEEVVEIFDKAQSFVLKKKSEGMLDLNLRSPRS